MTSLLVNQTCVMQLDFCNHRNSNTNMFVAYAFKQFQQGDILCPGV